MWEKRKRIAVMVDYLTSEYTEELLDGISRCCKENNVDLLNLVCGELKYDRNGTSYQYVAITSLIRENSVDGIVFTSGTQMHNVTSDFFTEYAKNFNVPYISNVSTVLPGIPSIISDSSRAFSDLLDYLIQNQKCKKILLMGVKSISSEVEERTRLFFDAIEKHGIAKDSVTVLKGKFDYPSAKEQLKNYYQENNSFDFDTIVSLNDDMAFACIDFCREIGLKVPEDVIVSGFDDLPRSSFSNLPLTTISQRISEQGYQAAQCVIDQINGIKVPLVQKIQASVVLRASTERIKYDESLSNQSELIFKDSSKYSVYEWFIKRNQLFDATKFYTDSSQNINLAQLKKILIRDLPKFDVNSLCIVVYDNPIEKQKPFDTFELPEKASVLAAYNKASDYVLDIYDDAVVFNPQIEIIPKQFDYFIKGDMVCVSLFKGTVQYGYMVFNKGNTDMTVYDILTRTISSLIGSVFSYKIVLDEQEKLRDRWIKTDIMASTDQLTGIKNRRYFFDIGKTTMTFAETVAQEGLVIFCDMDGLKKINDTYGHDAGDNAIISEAKILVKNFRTSDVVARIAGDEFAIICHGITLKDFDRIKTNIEKDCEKWTEENNSPFKLSITMGAVKYPSETVGYDLDKLLSLADKTLYELKRIKKKQSL